MPKAAFTGGGTMGHVLPGLALIPELTHRGYSIIYIGSEKPAERAAAEAAEAVFFPVSSGKLRRYFDLKNFTDIFKIIKGFFDALSVMRKEKPDVLFSKGGFVAVPVVYAAALCGIPVILHESDITMGLANRLCAPFAKKICHAFEETGKHIKEGKAVLTGIPVRKELFDGDRETGLSMCGFKTGKPVLLVMGGSQGAKAINQAVYNSLDKLAESFQICHICGPANVKDAPWGIQGYKAFGYANEEMKHLYAIADIVLARAGATSLFEFLALGLPSVLIPIPAKKSRGDQLKNAEAFVKAGFSNVLPEEDISTDKLVYVIKDTYEKKDTVKAVMAKARTGYDGAKIISLIEAYAAR